MVSTLETTSMTGEALANAAQTSDAPRRFMLAGLLIAPPLTPDQQKEIESRFRESITEEGIHLDRMPAFRAPVLPVYVDESGARFIMVQGDSGAMEAIPLEDADESPDMATASKNGGFIALDPKQLASDGSPELAAIRAAAAELLAGGAFPEFTETSHVANEDDESDQQHTGANGSAGMAALSPVLGHATGGLNMLNSQMADIGSLMKGIGQFGLGQLMSMGVQRLLGDVLSVKDSGGLGAHLAGMAGQKMVGELQGTAQSWLTNQIGLSDAPGGASATIEGYEKKIDAIFNGVTAGVSNASVPVGFLSAGNTADGAVTGGAGTVMVNGKPAARLGDMASMSKPRSDAGPIQSGNPTILAESAPLAGEGHVAVGTSRGIVALLNNCSPDVFMGPQGMPVAIPSPEAEVDKCDVQESEVEDVDDSDSDSEAEQEDASKPDEQSNESDSESPLADEELDELYSIDDELSEIDRQNAELNEKYARGKITDEEYFEARTQNNARASELEARQAEILEGREGMFDRDSDGKIVMPPPESEANGTNTSADGTASEPPPIFEFDNEVTFDCKAKAGDKGLGAECGFDAKGKVTNRLGDSIGGSVSVSTGGASAGLEFGATIEGVPISTSGGVKFPPSKKLEYHCSQNLMGDTSCCVEWTFWEFCGEIGSKGLSKQ